MNEAMKNLLERRSVRGYKKDLVPADVLDEILEAGKYAPSGMGQQKTLMVVTQDPELVAKLSRMNADVMGAKSDPFYGAPTVVIVFADSEQGVKTVIKGDPTAFMTGMQSGSIKMEGDFSLLVWFNQVAKLIPPKVPKPVKDKIKLARAFLKEKTGKSF